MYPILFRLGGFTVYVGSTLLFALLNIDTDRENPPRIFKLFHPTQRDDATHGLVIFVLLIRIERRKSFPGQIVWLFLLLYGMTRFMVEMFRRDPRGFLFGNVLSTSQGVGILLAILSLFMLFYKKKVYRSSKDGCAGNS